jgi:hypothetical protein
VSAIQAAQNAVNYVRKQVQVRSNNRKSDPPLTETEEEAGDTKTLAWLTWAAEHDSEPLADQFGSAKAALESRVGNCAQIAALAFAYLVEKESPRPVHLVAVLGGDHDLVLIGLTKWNMDWQKWNTDAVICDAWSEWAGPVEKLQEWLQGVSGHCIDKPEDYDVKQGPWQSVKELLKTTNVGNVRFVQSAEVKAGTPWTQKVIP